MCAAKLRGCNLCARPPDHDAGDYDQTKRPNDNVGGSFRVDSATKAWKQLEGFCA